MKNQKGITLIALVVTIIVLLILAGITIATLMGENGIIGNSQEAKTQNAYAQAREQMELAYMAVRTEIAIQTAKDGTYSPVTNVAALKTVVANELSGDKWDITNDASGKITMLYTDTAIDQGLIDGTHPTQEGKVTGIITVSDQTTTAAQTASFEFDK